MSDTYEPVALNACPVIHAFAFGSLLWMKDTDVDRVAFYNDIADEVTDSAKEDFVVTADIGLARGYHAIDAMFRTFVAIPLTWHGSQWWLGESASPIDSRPRLLNEMSQAERLAEHLRRHGPDLWPLANVLERAYGASNELVRGYPERAAAGLSLVVGLIAKRSSRALLRALTLESIDLVRALRAIETP